MRTPRVALLVPMLLSLAAGGCQSLGEIPTAPGRWVMASVPNHGTLRRIQTRISMDGIRRSASRRASAG